MSVPEYEARRADFMRRCVQLALSGERTRYYPAQFVHASFIADVQLLIRWHPDSEFLLVRVGLHGRKPENEHWSMVVESHRGTTKWGYAGMVDRILPELPRMMVLDDLAGT